MDKSQMAALIQRHWDDIVSKVGPPSNHRWASQHTGANCHTACARSHIGVATKIPSQSINTVPCPSPNTVLRGAMSPCRFEEVLGQPELAAPVW